MLAWFRRGLFYAYLTIYLRHYLGLSVTATTLFATLPMVVNTLSQNFIWGQISDRFQIRRSLIVAGEVLAALGTVTLWYFHRIMDSPISSGYIIIAGLAVVELFWSMSNIGWSALISDLYQAEQRGAIQGRLASMGGVGRMMGVWMGGLLYDGLGLQYAGWGFHQGPLFFLAAGVMLISVLPLFLLPEGGAFKPDEAIAPDPQISDETSAAELKGYIIFLVGMTLINFGRNSIVIIFPQYLSSSTGPALDSRTLAYVLNTLSVAVIAFGWMVGWICRRIGRQRALIAGTISAICSLIILWQSVSLPMIYFSSFLRGVAEAIILASAYEVASVYIPAAQRARRFAWFNATFFLSWGLPGTLLTGPLVDVLITAGVAEPIAYRQAFGAAAVLTFTGMVIQTALFFGKKKRRGNAIP